MDNLAGVRTEEADRQIRRELAHARIEIIEHSETISHPEVHTHLSGELGGWTFSRNWCYWVAEGRMPLEKARELWADPLGKDDVRVGGHCGCPSPDEYGTEYLSSDGKRLYSDPDGKKAKAWEEAVKNGIFPGGDREFRFVPDAKLEAATGYVDGYHVDSVAGLRLLADVIRGLAAKPPKTESVELPMPTREPLVPLPMREPLAPLPPRCPHGCGHDAHEGRVCNEIIGASQAGRVVDVQRCDCGKAQKPDWRTSLHKPNDGSMARVFGALPDMPEPPPASESDKWCGHRSRLGNVCRRLPGHDGRHDDDVYSWGSKEPPAPAEGAGECLRRVLLKQNEPDELDECDRECLKAEASDIEAAVAPWQEKVASLEAELADLRKKAEEAVDKLRLDLALERRKVEALDREIVQPLRAGLVEQIGINKRLVDERDANAQAARELARLRELDRLLKQPCGAGPGEGERRLAWASERERLLAGEGGTVGGGTKGGLP